MTYLCLFCYCFYAAVQIPWHIVYISMPVEHQLWQVKVGKENLFYFVPSASNVPKETQGTLSLTEPSNKANLRKAAAFG